MATLVDFSTLVELFDNVRKHYDGQNRAAVAFKSKSTKQWTDVSWEDLGAQVDAFSAWLYDRGVRKGDRVAILSENRVEWAVADMATQRLGGINVSLYTSLPASQVSFILKDSGSKVIVVSAAIQLRKAEEVFDDCPDLQHIVTMSKLKKERGDFVHQWEACMEEGRTRFPDLQTEIQTAAQAVEPKDVSCLIYTSGTTGLPKGVMLTHNNLCSNASSALTHVPFGPSDHHLSFLPLSHSFERIAGYTAVMAAGAKITYAESIDAVSKNLVEVSPTVMVSVPRLFERVYNIIAKSVEDGSAVKKAIFEWSVSSGMQFAKTAKPGAVLKARRAIAQKLVFQKLHDKLGNNLRFAVSGGAALPKQIGEFFQAAGITIIEGYGLTETSPVLTINPMADPRYGTVGHVMNGVTVGIQRLTDQEIIAQVSGSDYPTSITSDPGEIVAKGPNIMKGYWKNESATSEAIDSDGWYHTGDVGRFEDGYLRITDRIKHMIVSKGGKNIYPGPIEEMFATMPIIDQLMVVGEGQPFLVALAVPNEESLRTLAKTNNLSASSIEEIMAEDVVVKEFESIFKTYSRNAASHEKIRKFHLIREPFSVDNELMTPTMKLKRKAIETRYKSEIDTMYEGVV